MKREAGLLFPISSLWGKYGIGTLGKSAYEFIDFLKESQLKIWQILPLNVTSFGNSPYQSPSNYALNYNFIDFDALIEKELLTREEVENEYWGDNETRINYGALFNNKLKVLKKAFNRFDKNDKDFINFLETMKNYSDFAVFMVLKDMHNLKAWYEWHDEYSVYSPAIEKEIKTNHKEEYLFYMWTQFEFLNEYRLVKKYANDKGIKIMGDLPIYVAYDSVEVWKYPYLFELDERLNPKRVAGVPPDPAARTACLFCQNGIVAVENGAPCREIRHRRVEPIGMVLRCDHHHDFGIAFAELLACLLDPLIFRGRALVEPVDINVVKKPAPLCLLVLGPEAFDMRILAAGEITEADAHELPFRTLILDHLPINGVLRAGI